MKKTKKQKKLRGKILTKCAKIHILAKKYAKEHGFQIDDNTFDSVIHAMEQNNKLPKTVCEMQDLREARNGLLYEFDDFEDGYIKYYDRRADKILRKFFERLNISDLDPMSEEYTPKFHRKIWKLSQTTINLIETIKIYLDFTTTSDFFDKIDEKNDKSTLFELISQLEDNGEQQTLIDDLHKFRILRNSCIHEPWTVYLSDVLFCLKLGKKLEKEISRKLKKEQLNNFFSDFD